jgi:hypothetical protein
VALWNSSLPIAELQRQLRDWQRMLHERPRIRALLLGVAVYAALATRSGAAGKGPAPLEPAPWPAAPLEPTWKAVAEAETSVMRLDWSWQNWTIVSMDDFHRGLLPSLPSLSLPAYRASKWRTVTVWFVLPLDDNGQLFTFYANGCDGIDVDCPVPASNGAGPWPATPGALRAPATLQQPYLSLDYPQHPQPMYDDHGLPHGVVPTSETVWSWSMHVDVEFCDTRQSRPALYLYEPRLPDVIYKIVVSTDSLLVNVLSPRLQYVTVVEGLARPYDAEDYLNGPKDMPIHR